MTVFSQNGRKLFRGKLPPKFPGKMSRQFFPEKFSWKKFPTKVLRHNFRKMLIYRLQVVTHVYVVNNFARKLRGENSRRENFGKSGKLPAGKISPRDFPRDFRAFSGNRSVNQDEKVASGDFPGNFSTSFPRNFRGKRRDTFFGKVFLQKFPTKVSWHKLYTCLIYRLQTIIQV